VIGVNKNSKQPLKRGYPCPATVPGTALRDLRIRSAWNMHAVRGAAARQSEFASHGIRRAIQLRAPRRRPTIQERAERSDIVNVVKRRY